MKVAVSRSAVLTAVVIAVLVAATPFAVADFFEKGELYILSRRFMDDLIARLHGPGRLRFIFQPATAIVLGVRDGVKDAHAGNPPFLWGLVFRAGGRRVLLSSALVSVGDLLAIAILVDAAAQLLILRMVYPGAALILGPVLIAIPYASSRALANRIIRRRERHVPVVAAH